jgi:Ras-related protein Rab-8A
MASASGGGKGAQYDHLVKLLLVGDAGVGKTNLLSRFAEGTYDPHASETIGIDFKVKMMTLGGRKVKLQIWDTAGQERFNTITQQYYRNAMGVVLVYDCTSEESFNNIQRWAAQIAAHSAQGTNQLLLGNKADSDCKAVDKEAGQALADGLGVAFFETSAKSGQNVQQAFETIAFDVVRRMQEDCASTASGFPPIYFREKIVLSAEPAEKRAGCCSGA